MRILFALLIILTGLALVFGGFRIARILIPLWGFVSGLALGGSIAASMSGTPFLGTLTGIIVGLAAGIVLAFFAYFYYWAAVIIMAGTLGYWIGTEFLYFLHISPGFFSSMVGLILGVVVGGLALLLNAPKYVLIVITAVAGAIASIGGILLLFNAIPLEAFSYVTAKAAISVSWFWTLVTAVLAVVGAVVQTRMTTNYTLERWAAGSDDTTHHPFTPTTHPRGVH